MISLSGGAARRESGARQAIEPSIAPSRETKLTKQTARAAICHSNPTPAAGCYRRIDYTLSISNVPKSAGR